MPESETSIGWEKLRKVRNGAAVAGGALAAATLLTVPLEFARNAHDRESFLTGQRVDKIVRITREGAEPILREGCVISPYVKARGIVQEESTDGTVTVRDGEVWIIKEPPSFGSVPDQNRVWATPNHPVTIEKLGDIKSPLSSVEKPRN